MLRGHEYCLHIEVILKFYNKRLRCGCIYFAGYTTDWKMSNIDFQQTTGVKQQLHTWWIHK